MKRTDSGTSLLQTMLKGALKGQAYPIVSSSQVCPGASLWIGGIQVSGRFREMGIAPGERVGVSLPNDVPFVQTMLGCLRAGVVFCPVPFPLDSAAKEEIWSRLGVRLVITTSNWHSFLEGELRPIEITHSLKPVGGSQNPAWILWTSGTGGISRPIGLSEEILAHQVSVHCDALKLQPSQEIVSYLSWAHAFGGVLELLVGLASGAIISVPCRDRFEPSELLHALELADAPACFSVPKVLELLLSLPGGPAAIQKISNGIVGGAPLSAALATTLTKLGCRLRIGYGQTECGPGILLGEQGVFNPGLLGRPIGCETKIGNEGQLLVSGPNTAMAREGEWWDTGDLVRLDSNKNYHFCGRLGRCWKWSNGRLYNPGPDEETLSARTGREVVLLKGITDVAVPFLKGSIMEISQNGLGTKLDAPVFVSKSNWDLATTPSGKISPQQLANRYPEAVDPLLYKGSCPIGAGSRLTVSSLLGDNAFALSPQAKVAIEDAHRFALAKAATDMPIYGWKTGFGPLVKFGACETPEDQGFGLLAHLQAGQGPDLPNEVVKAMLVLRLHTAGQGRSGLSPEAASWIESAIQADLIPVVPSFGSVGASGDLIPMAHAIAAYRGEGEIVHQGVRKSARQALRDAGQEPITLRGRDALALVNGTPLMTAIASVVVGRYRRLLGASVELGALLYELLGCNHQPLHPALHVAANHPTHQTVAERMQKVLDGVDGTGLGRPLQESYSLRCIPQLLGACLTTLQHVEAVLEAELNGVTDNPIFDPTSDAVAHGGNFFGQEIAFVMDQLMMAIVQTGNLVERQLALLVEPAQTDGLPLLLSAKPGAQSGVAGVQLSATATIAEMRRRAMPASIQSIPTNGMNQDIVPLGTHASLNALQQVEMLELLIGSLAVGIRQAFWLSDREPSSPRGQELWKTLLLVAPIAPDRALAADVRLLGSKLRESGLPLLNPTS